MSSLCGQYCLVKDVTNVLVYSRNHRIAQRVGIHQCHYYKTTFVLWYRQTNRQKLD